MVSRKLFMRWLIESLVISPSSCLCFRLEFTYMAPFTMVWMGLVSSSFFLDSCRLWLSKRCGVDLLICVVERDFLRWSLLEWLLLIFVKHLDGCPKSEEKVGSLCFCGLRWLERTAYRFEVGRVYLQKLEAPRDECISSGGRIAVGPRELYGLTLDHKLSTLGSTWDVCFKRLALFT
jgi:hypothetical protein